MTRDEQLLQAVGRAIATAKSELRTEFEARIASLDGSNVLKTAAGALLAADLMAVNRYVDEVVFTKAQIVAGSATGVVKSALGAAS